jgi:biopolymer transport protein ExbD
MKIKSRNHFQAEVATSSLNDIMFFLLLFFLIISTITNPNVINVLLPKSKASQTLNKQPVSVTMTEDKKYYINKQQIPFESLEEALVKECAGMQEPTAVLRIPANSTVQDLVTIMEIGARNKIKMILATKKK